MIHQATTYPRLKAAASAGALGLLVALAARADSLPLRSRSDWAGMPLCFEANRGQAGNPAQFLARGHDYQFLITPSSAQLVLRKVGDVALASPFERDTLASPRPVSLKSVRMQFVGADPQAHIEGDGQMPGKINYFIGNDPAQWRSRVPLFAKVRVDALYPGVDLLYYGNQHQLEYDFTVAPKADPGRITIRFDGVNQLEISDQGELVVKLGADEIRQPRPVLYQMVKGARQEVSGGYRLRDATTVGFEVGRYNHDLPLIIDPVLTFTTFSTYFGGAAGDIALGVKVDTNGNIYVVGETLSTQFATPNAFQTNFAGGTINGDGFVAKVAPNGSGLVYLTYLGGSGEDGVLDLAVDDAGHAFVTGFTASTNFPVFPASGVPGIPASTNIGGTLITNNHVNIFPTDGFVAELETDGSSLIYSTYLGGSAIDVADAIAIDPAGNAYVTGYTYSTNFPTTNAILFHLAGATNTQTQLNHMVGTNMAFVTKIAANGAGLVYSTFLGGTNFTEGQGIAVDAAGFAYVSGYTDSTNFPITTNALSWTNGQPWQINHSTNAATLFRNRPIPFDGFIARIGPEGTNLDYSTYFGGTNRDAAFRIRVPAGTTEAYLTGVSESPDFPNTATNVPGLHHGANGTNFLNEDAFLAKFDFSTNPPALVYSALFGDTNNDIGWDVAVDSAGDAFVVGITASKNFPHTNTFGFLQATNSGTNDVFITGFDSGGSNLLFSAYLGGSSNDFGYGIAADITAGATNLFVVGKTYSKNFPTTNSFGPSSLYRTNLNSTNDAFLAVIALPNPPAPAALRAGTNFAVAWPAGLPAFPELPVLFRLESSTNFAAPGSWRPVRVPPALVTNGPPTNLWYSVTLDPTNPAQFFRLRKY